MKASVIVSVKNGENFLSPCLESILNQTYEDYELIVVDDGSTDRTDDILSELLTRTQRWKKIRLSGRGATAALNIGLALSSGEYIVRCDADDVLFPERLEKQFEFLDSHPEIVACGSAVELVDPNEDRLGERDFPSQHQEIVQTLLSGKNCIVHSSAVIRSSALKSVGGYDESYPFMAEFDLWLKLSEVGNLANLSQRLIKKRLHPGSSHNLNCKQRIDCLLRSLQNYRRRHQLIGGPEDPIKRIQKDLANIDVTPKSQEELEANWYQMAIESGNLKTASKYAWQRALKSPLSIENWVEATKLEFQASKKAA